MNLEVQIVDHEPRLYAYIEVPEGTDEHDMPGIMQRLQAWVMGHKEPTLPVIVDRRLRDVAAGSYPIEVRAPFPHELGDDAVPRLRTGKWPIDLKRIDRERVARCRFRGPADRLPAFEHAFVMFLRGQGQPLTGRLRHVFHVTGDETNDWDIEVEVELEP